MLNLIFVNYINCLLDNVSQSGSKVNKIIPFIVSMQLNGIHQCGGTLYKENFIITAAHCIKNNNNTKGWTARFKFINFEDKNPIIIKLIKRYPYPDYNEETFFNDIAIWELKSPFKDVDANTVKISDGNCINKDYGNGIVYGWGATKEDGEISNELKSLNIPILPFEKCKNVWYDPSDTESQTCAGSFGSNLDSCTGDSGSPLIKYIDHVPYLLGIVSHGEGCGRINKPGVYTKVSHYFNWINKITNSTAERFCATADDFINSLFKKYQPSEF